MFLEGPAQGRPVLLFLHGGPGMPEYWLTRRRPTRMHEGFTVAWWEQRGAGLSYHPDIPAATMTVEQIVADTLAVAQHLCRRFDVEKVHLMAHSWGSFIGLQAAARVAVGGEPLVEVGAQLIAVPLEPAGTRERVPAS